MTVRRIAVALLLLAGAGLVALGVQNWLRRREAVNVVNAFLSAIQEGNRRGAIDCLQTGPAPGGAAAFTGADSPLWTPTPDVACRITEMEFDGDTARAKVWIEKDGFVLEPTLHLVHDSSWKIARIEDLKVDPLWLELQRDAARRQGDRDAADLQRALKDRPGVTVQRGPLPDGDEK
jgi:hypothetical protein